MKPNSFLKYSLGLAFAATPFTAATGNWFIACAPGRADARHPIDADLRSLAR